MKYISLWAILLVARAGGVDHGVCDHAAPPPGMHYVCAPADSCNCRLEKDEPVADAEGKDSRVSGEACAASGLQHFVAPDYPLAAWQAGKQGMVQAQVVVGPSGILKVKIESGDPVFAQPVTDTLKTWKFAPSESQRIYAISIRFRFAGTPTGHPATTVGGASPLELEVTAHPPPH
jgi:Gram-negative bacterial TonB protein C-terminal